ncbi:uncharacterized protein LOC111241222 [Vigna radiata var. radiata]|uniref:Uncharacterized protein LOC111241222 n=1 Tax=Vigna radiata var. radiata TaxID=3916 RepID=A0A3Q0EUL3_VIGRR|nr:uncharacterized protein LOC111241222 [Vigna radiata var. radiata]
MRRTHERPNTYRVRKIKIFIISLHLSFFQIHLERALSFLTSESLTLISLHLDFLASSFSREISSPHTVIVTSRPFGVSLLIAGHDENGPSFFSKMRDMRKIFPFELFHLGGDEVNTVKGFNSGWYWSSRQHSKSASD